jgi:hypothetical protein
MALLVWGCGQDEHGVEGVLFEGSATDETWHSLEDANLTESEADTPHLLTPTSISRTDPPPRFTWDGGALAQRPALKDRGRPRQGTHGFELERLFTSVAKAHLPPVSGPVYRLHISSPGATDIWVVTTVQEHTPPVRLWNSIRESEGPVTIDLVGALFNLGIIEDGPYVSPTPVVLDIL